MHYTVADPSNPLVRWEMGLVSARRIRMPTTRPGWVDYQVVWRLPHGAVRGSVQMRNGEMQSGYLAYYDPNKFAETRLYDAAWVYHSFNSPEGFRQVALTVAKAMEALPIQPIPDIPWSAECLPTCMRKLESPTA